mgnify:CR=1 FL=1
MPIFSDNFNRANEALEDGANWAADTAPGLYNIVTNQVVVTTGGDFNTVAWVDGIASRADMIVECDMRPTSTLQNPGLFVIARRTGLGNLYSAGVGGPDHEPQIRKQVASVTTILASAAGIGASTGFRTYRIEVEGTAIRLFIGGALQLSTTDSSHTAAGFGGILSSSADATSNAIFDLFSISEFIVAAPALPAIAVPLGPAAPVFEVPDEPYGRYKSTLTLHEQFSRARLG